MNERISSATCIASSLVGARMIACVSFECSVIFSARGIQNAAVLPLPVAACHMILVSPASRRGIVFSCIGDGTSNHFFSNALRVASLIPSALNFSNLVMNKLAIKNSSHKGEEQTNQIIRLQSSL